MASQAQLEADIALATAQVDSLKLQLDQAAGSPQPDPAVIANIERSLSIAENNLSSLQSQLSNLTIAANDPNTNVGNDTEQLPRVQQSINPNTDPNTNIGEEIQNSAPADIGTEDPFEASRRAAENDFNNTTPVTEQDVFASEGVTNAKGLQGKLNSTRARQITQDAENAKTQGDWRVRLSLAKSADYLYKAANPGILKYLQATDGVVFPYTPAVQITYAANYEASDIVHSNYKLIQYKNSAVDQIAITCDFTAQDTNEANYLLAVIHFFKSVTKMFYGKDEIPKPGTPPPLCYLTGLGSFQFDNHPLVITNFNYNLPNDVDYIRAGSPTLQPGIDSTAYNGSKGADSTSSILRLVSSGLNTGAQKSAPQFTKATNTQPTYVPTKMQIVLSAYPIVTRNDISNKFSLKDYATGSLLQGSRRNGGGIW